MRTFIVLLLFIRTSFCLYGQLDSVAYEVEDYDFESEAIDPESLNSTSTYKSESVQVRKFDRERWKEVIGETDFDEKPIEEKPAKDLNPPSIPWNSGVLRLISYIIIIAIVVAIVFLIAKNSSLTSKPVRKAATTHNISGPVENINAIDLDAWLQKAKAEGDLRLAIRVYFLALLRNLNETGKIAWRKNKTNLDYLYELLSKGFYYEEIRKVTLAYEVVWYGERPLSQTAFDELAAEFESIKKVTNPNPQ